MSATLMEMLDDEVRQRVRDARNAALEEAAEVCDEIAEAASGKANVADLMIVSTSNRCADSIRALKSEGS